ncbi:protein of unknown function [Streptantibioticus cattleyicolor NRRL 8057 = DSM 46488]|nr:protein of unknown function [Streptantibioticus cattleyicolor NRRL 8057 = DSM 46488]
MARCRWRTRVQERGRNAGSYGATATLTPDGMCTLRRGRWSVRLPHVPTGLLQQDEPPAHA